MTDAAGIVLCGGNSSRMGRAKAWLPWRGKPLVSHVVDVLRGVFDEVVVVSAETLELPPLCARVVCDREPALGPLAGIREGLGAIEAKRAFVTATDAPFLTGDFARSLLARGDCVAPVVEGFVQTLAAVYPKRALEIADRLISEARLRPLHLLEALGYEAVAEAEVPDLAPLRGFNTPEDYLKAVRDDDQDAAATVEFVGRARLAAGREPIRVPVGTLAEVLACAPSELALVENGRVTPPFLASIDGRAFFRNAGIPVGPGERVIVLDSAAGG
jgi:molybdopterin-guanine dinucleotide biosynthesis protein A